MMLHILKLSYTTVPSKVRVLNGLILHELGQCPAYCKILVIIIKIPMNEGYSFKEGFALNSLFIDEQ